MKKTLLFTFLATMVACGGDSSSDNTTQNPLSDDSPQDLAIKISDLSNGYYGKMYTAGGDEVSIKADDILPMQRQFIDELKQHIPQDSVNKYQQYLEDFLNYDFKTETETVLFQNALLNAMLDETDQKTQLRYQPSVRLFQHHTHLLFPISRIDDFPVLTDFLFARSILEHLPLYIPDTEDDYIQTCRENNVPIPPDWGSGDWNYMGDAEVDFLRNELTEIWAYSDPNVAGTCIALPRKESGVVSLLGIICQSSTTGKACFWDNLSKENGLRITGGDDLTFAIEDIHNGDILAENCTECHRGSNVFLIHPGTNLDISDQYTLEPAVRYTPVSQQEQWQNPPAHTELGTGTCASCHEIADLSYGYCTLVLTNAANITMPNLENPAGWNNSHDIYGQHLAQIIEDCRTP